MTTTVDSTQTSAKDGDTNKTETSGEQPVKQVDKSVILSTGSLPDGTKYHVRRMTFDDIEEVLKVWESIGLYEGTNSIQTFLTVDPEGFYVAINEKDGSIIGEVGAVFIEPSTAFIGLYAVRPDHQKMGVGYAVWKQMMKHVGDKNVGLYAIDTQYDMYRYKAGLGIEDDVKIIEFKMTKETSPETLDNLISTLDNVELVQVNRNDEIVNKIIEYDQTIVGHDRSRLIPLIISEPDALCLAAIEKMSGKILGYGVVHTSIVNKAMIGPLFAHSNEVAELLLRQLIEQFPMAKTSGYFLMIPDSHKDFIKTLSKLNCQPEHILPRLFRSFCPEIKWSQAFCITSPNYTVI